jgi:hypothetical protein
LCVGRSLTAFDEPRTNPGYHSPHANEVEKRLRPQARGGAESPKATAGAKLRKVSRDGIEPSASIEWLVGYRCTLEVVPMRFDRMFLRFAGLAVLLVTAPVAAQLGSRPLEVTREQLVPLMSEAGFAQVDDVKLFPDKYFLVFAKK